MAGTVVICFTDIVGSTALQARVGDDTFDTMRRAHFGLLGREIEAHGGELVKNLGDGAMAAFGSASDAVAAAVAMQRAVEAEGRRGGDDAIAIRVGISAGDATEEDGDWFGAPVVEGARLCAAASPGQILVSEVVRLLAGNRGGHELHSVGELSLKGLPEPLQASEVRWPPAQAVASSLPGPLRLAEGELPFSGRAGAVAVLKQVWAAAGRAEPQLVMVAGEPGVGKTRLVAEFARAVHASGAIVLLGRADEHVDAPYGPWREALKRAVASLPDELLRAHVAQFGGEVARLVPDLARRISDLPAPAASDPETERLLLFEAVAGLLIVASGEAPVLLVLDDVHWADESSLLLLLHLLRGGVPAELAVVATYRDTDVDRVHPLAGVLADLRRVRGATRLSLDGLDAEGVVHLLTAAGGHELDEQARSFAAELFAETEGNPFFLVEVLRHLTESGGLVRADGRWRAGANLAGTGLPEGVREVIGRRLAALPEATNDLLGVASVLGREFDLGLVAAVAEATVAEVLDVLAPAESARLIEVAAGRPGRFSFAHALVRATLYEELGTNRRVRLHRAAALALEATPDPPIGELAHHFGEAAVMGETDRAVRYARQAAEAALALPAPREAVALARRALQAVDLAGGGDEERATLLLLQGRALTAAGDLGAMDPLARAFEAAAAVGDWSMATEAAVLYGGGLLGMADDRALDQLDRVLAHLDAGDSELRVEALARRAQWKVNLPGGGAARDALEAHDMAARLGSAEARHRAAAAVALSLRNIDRVAMLASAEEALRNRRGSSTQTTVTAFGQQFEALLGLGDLDGLERALESCREDFESSPERLIPVHQATLGSTLAGAAVTLAVLRGDLEAAEGLVAVAATNPLRASNALGFAVLVEFGWTQLAYHRGDWGAASAGWERTRAVAPDPFAVYFGFGAVGCPLGELAGYVEAWFEVDATSPEVTKASNVAVVAEALRRLGEGARAAAYAERFTGHAGFLVTNSSLYCHGPFDTALGVLFTTAGQLDRAVGHLEAGVARCATIGSPTFGSIARLELATTLRLRGGPDDAARAAELTAGARAAMATLGMHGWVNRAERLADGDLEPWRIEVAG